MDTREPDPSYWTLRLKHHKSTILLYAEPITSFTSIKQELLRILRQTHSSGMVNGHRIPSDPGHVILGVPVDPSDLRKGWTALGTPNTENDDDDDDDVAAAAAAATAAAGPTTRTRRRAGGVGANGSLDCPQGAGLKDGAVLAFKFKSHDMNGSGDAPVEAEQWDVLLPTYEEEYGNGSQPLDDSQSIT